MYDRKIKRLSNLIVHIHVCMCGDLLLDFNILTDIENDLTEAFAFVNFLYLL